MRLLMAAALVLSTGIAKAESEQFKGSTETDDQLVEFYRRADGECRQVMAEDARTVAGCASRAIYGQALNERGLCLETEGHDSALPKWRACGDGAEPFEAAPIPQGWLQRDPPRKP